VFQLHRAAARLNVFATDPRREARMSGWIRRHRLVAFFVLSYAVAWAGWPFWAAGLLPEPLFLACGPLVAALVVVGVAEGRPGYGALFERMTRWRVGALWWVVALTLPPAMVLATALLNTAAGAPAAAFGGLAWGELALLFGLYLVNPLGGALGEEPGWRGYALPRLQADRTPLAAALVLGVLVAGWHLPLVVFGMLGAIGLLSTAAITVVYVWLFNRGRGSALLILVAHALQDSFTFGSLGYSAADTARAEYLYCLVVVVVAATLVVVDRAAWSGVTHEPPPADVRANRAG
jgi:membrane protease YdiL (CAAX protease family)